MELIQCEDHLKDDDSEVIEEVMNEGHDTFFLTADGAQQENLNLYSNLKIAS